MADSRIGSVGGNDTNSGATWALRKATVNSALALDVAGDTIFLAQNHSETPAVALGFPIAGTPANPSKMYCVSDSADAPTALATTASFATTGASTISFNGSFYAYGIIFSAGDAANTANINPCANSAVVEYQTYDTCDFIIPNTSASSGVVIGNLTASVSHKCAMKNTRVKFAAAAQRITVAACDFVWRGGSAITGTTTPTTGLILNAGTGRAGNILVEGVDLSNFASTLALVSGSCLPGNLVFIDVKLPASWGGALFSAAPPAGVRAELYNVDLMHIEDHTGSIKSNTTVLRTSGAPLSWKMTTTASANYPLSPLESGVITKWNTVTGTPITAEIEVVTDNITLTDAEAWIEMHYMNAAGEPQSVIISDAKASILATTAAAAQATSAAGWTTTGLTTPVTQKLSVTFTAQVVGYVRARVCFARASSTLYACPKMSVA